MVADLKRSGLDADDAKTLRLKTYEAGELTDIFPAGAGYTIPYFTIEGAPNAEIFRYRYLEDIRTGFAKVANAKVRRYTQPAGVAPGVYFPPFVDWGRISSELMPILITEGEKKAAVATKLGVPTLGLGGVWSFRSKNRNMRLLPELEAIQWSERDAFIVYDSDAVSNPDICMAEAALAHELGRLGAKVFILRLPNLSDGKKCGLDDFIVENGTDAIIEMTQTAEPFEMCSALHEMNSEVIYVRDPGAIYVWDNGQIVRPHDFLAHRFADRQYTRNIPLPKGGSKLEVRSTATDWLKWPARAAANKFVFAPSDGPITDKGEVNLWKGWSYEPIEGDVSLWAELLDHIFEGEPLIRDYFEKWAAFPIQHPGTKLRNGVAVWGRKKGTGKSLIGYSLGDLYGDAFSEIDDTHVEGKVSFNQWARHKHFILADEITGNDARAVANRIKSMITREWLEINIKNIPQYTIADCLNYYFTANSPDCFYLEEDDRRLLIHEMRGVPKPMPFYRAYDKWRRSEAGRCALMHHLLYNVDTTDFDPMARPPETAAKAEMFSLTRTDLEDWLIGVRSEPDIICGKFSNSDLVTPHELIAVYDALGVKHVSSVLMSRKLKESGFDALRPTDRPNNTQIRVGDRLVRLYALRNGAKWAKATLVELRDHYELSRGIRSKPAKF